MSNSYPSVFLSDTYCSYFMYFDEGNKIIFNNDKIY